MIPIRNDKLNSLAEYHYHNIEQHLKRPRINKFDAINNWFMTNGLRLSLHDVVVAPYELLVRVKDSYYQTSYPSEVNYLKNLYNDYFSKSGQYINDEYNAVILVEKLGLKVCPYCNRSFINNVNLEQRGLRRTSQLDHFFSKGIYPFLALSFYNLVPSCPSCNHLKHNKSIDISPYDENIEHDELIKFDYDIKSVDYLHNEKDIEVKVRFKDEIKRNVKELGLESQYLIHSDIVYELIKKMQIYNESHFAEIMRNFPKLFKDEHEMKRVVFGNYLSIEDIHKRPLAKLTKDIYEKIYNTEST
jgi:hypothetical protein